MDKEQVAINLYQTIRLMLWEDWDPIGVNQISDTDDEYDSYVPGVVNLVKCKAGKEEIFEYLWALETGHIGLEGDRENTMRFADKLVAIASKLTSGI